jgi:hypothetical protein
MVVLCSIVLRASSLFSALLLQDFFELLARSSLASLLIAYYDVLSQANPLTTILPPQSGRAGASEQQFRKKKQVYLLSLPSAHYTS